MKKTILAIETSCDETAVSVVQCEKTESDYNFEVLSNVVASQIDIHKKWGGVYPELASRAHLEAMLPVLESALRPIPEIKNLKLKTKNLIHNGHTIPSLSRSLPSFIIQNSIDAIAVTVGPGLIGSLLMGVETAQVLASYFNKPVVSVNHLEGHIYSAFCAASQKSKVENSLEIRDLEFGIPQRGIFPILALVVSGGHTSLVLMDKHLSYKTIGQTIDDAVGEAFDKVARILNLGYPGGPAIEKLAKSGDVPIENRGSSTASVGKNAYKLPLPMLSSKDFNFSFSGLKTAVLYQTWDPKTQKKKKHNKADLAASFQKTVTEILIQKTVQAIRKYQPKTIILSGGVSANSYLREKFSSKLPATLVPPRQLSTDNAVGIGIAGAIKFLNKKLTNWSKITAQASFNIESNSQY